MILTTLVILLVGVQFMQYYNKTKIDSIITKSMEVQTENISLFYVDRELYMVDKDNNIYRLEKIK